jgi:FlaA1/EpsC-like NDP-sugar epimerase
MKGTKSFIFAPVTRMLHILTFSEDRKLPRLVIFFIDLVICLFAIGIAYQVRFNFQVPKVELDSFPLVYSIVVGIRAVSFLLSKTYKGIIRYTGTNDAARIVLTLASGSAVMAIVNMISHEYEGIYIIPFSIIILEFLLTGFGMVFGRLAIKEIYMELKNPSSGKTGVIIYGAGEAGLITKRTLDRDRGTRYQVKAFIDDDARKSGNKVEGVTIHPPVRLPELLADGGIQHLIIAVQNLPAAKIQEIAELALPSGVRILNVPPVTNWINGELSYRQIRNVNIEDLLGREPIRLDTDRIASELRDRVVLVTGAAGSIGSELVRQILPFRPRKLVMLDVAESPLYELELEVKEDLSTNDHAIETIIGDVRNEARMRNVFKTFKPQVVFHAAAYKHVPVMELNPSESILNNVIGTRIIADLAKEFGCLKFVMISTDKAVNPTNIMGATKRIAEMYTQSLNSENGTRFITTRFGNVLGSNGSVIPRFKKQIESGREVTVTHPEITRFFMTISEACQLVLEAAAMGEGGEIFLFDMGKPVRIADLAVKMIRLSGLEEGKDISIRYTGLRPGEKLYEELLANEENTLPTHHEKILIARVKPSDRDKITHDVLELGLLFSVQDNEALVIKMKQMVPEFISNNSTFEKLDKTGQ